MKKLVLDKSYNTKKDRIQDNTTSYLVVLSAKTQESLLHKIYDLHKWLTKEGNDFPLGHISYTLLVARNHYACRYAVVINEKKSLIQILDKCFREKDLHTKISESGNKGKQCSEEHIDNILNTTVEERFSQQNMATLAAHYLSGGSVLWKELFQNSSCRKIPMPTYHFVNDSYWVESSKQEDEQLDCIEKQKVIDEMHPLVDYNTSNLHEVSFEKKLIPTEFFMEHHQVGKELILPGVAYLEMARYCSEALSPNKKVVKLTDIRWHHSISLKEKDENKTVKIQFQPTTDDNNKLYYQVVSEDELLEDNRIHGTGNIYMDSNYESNTNIIPIEEVKSRCEFHMSKQECYTQFHQRGLHLGESFQSIKSLYVGHNEGIGSLVLPSIREEDFTDYLLHPTLMDGALETVIGIVNTNTQDKNATTLPYKIEEVTIYNSINTNCYAYSRLSKEYNNEDDEAFDVDILDEQGHILVSIKGFTLKRLSSNYREDIESKCYTYTPYWEKKEIIESTYRKETIILVNANEEVENILRTSHEVVTVNLSDGYKEKGNNHYTVNKYNSDDYIRVIENITNKQITPTTIMWFFDSINSRTKEIAINNLYPVYHITKEFINLNISKNMKLLYMYRSNEIEAKHAAIGAFLKSVKQEQPTIKVKVVRVDNDTTIKKVITDELLEETYSREEVSYEKDQRSIRILKEVELEDTPSKPCYKAGGVYLITGGLGGIGLKLAKYITEKAKCNIILTGRSALDKYKQRDINNLLESGCKVEYIRSDITDKEQVEKLINYTKKQYGKINGVFHVAGLTSDKLLREKTIDETMTVINPKVIGTVNLDKALKNEDIEYMVMFSSVASVGGNIAQCDYAYGNAFMDYYRQNREYMNVINWSLWEDGGMTLDDATMKLYKEVKGLKPLSTQSALEVMDKIIKSTYNQVIVIDGQKDKIEKALGKNKNEKKLTDSPSVNATKMREYVFLRLKKMIHNMLKVKKNHIKIDDDFSKFGFNSITFTQYANEINDAFQVAITPAIFFEYTKIDCFTDYIMDKYAKEVEETYSNSSSTVIKKSSNEKIIKRPIRYMKKINIEDNKSIKVEDNKVTNKETEFAIIGMDGMMPMSENLDEFFEHLVSEDDLISEIPQERWDYKEYYSETGHEPNKTFAKWGGFMKEIDKFDSGFFSISPREAELMDPQQRLFLQSVWKTIEDAGYNPRSLAGSKTGLFVGVSTIDYYDMMKEKGVSLDAQLSTGVSHCLLANRISYLLDLHGPSEPVDTACSSSLIAIHRAISSIMSGDCELAIAGGVNILASPMLFITFGKAGMLSKDGRCKAFDKSANGYVRGEGVGSILIKPLSKAEADGDHIYGVIKSTAINHGGKVNSITSPNPNAQKELLKTAYEKANINPATVSYIEAHGTGTSLGDPIEINALKGAFANMIKQYDDDIDNTNYIGIGTVKTNIGHLETAAGIAGVLKVLLSFQHKKIPGNVHLKEVNPYINLEDSPFYLVKRTQHWEAIKDKHGNKYPRRAGISSFGFGGANAHVVLEEYKPPNDISTPITQNEQQLIILSARNEDRLKEYTRLLRDYLQKISRHEHYLTLLHDDILNILAQSLQIEKEYIGQEELQEYGMDAISYNDFLRKISSQYSIDFNNITMEEHNTVNKILKLLECEHINKIREYYKSNNNLDISLDDIAYTLQVGRDAMDYRLACVSTSIEQLINGLTGYLDDKPITGVYVGSSKRTDREKGNISKEESSISIAEKWVKGTDYNWNDAYSGQKRLRISLPTYPFLRKRHWFDKLISKTTPSHKDYKITPSLETKSLDKNKIEDKTEDKAIDKATAIEPYTYKKVYNTYNTKDNPYTGSEVTLEIIHNHIALVIMEDKENKNMFSESLIQGLEFTFDKIHQNKDIKVVVVTGYDNVFSMGGTQHQLNAIADEKNQFTDIPFLFRGFLESEIPVISAMQGHASGGGMLFGLYADMVVMSNESIYTASFMKYGFTPGMGATYILKEKLGANVATEMMYTAKYYKGEDLKNKGASVIFRDRKDVLNEALSIAKQLIDKPRNTLKVLKEELSRRSIDQLTYVLDSEVIMHNKTFTDNEVKKRIYAQFNQGKQKTKYNTLQDIIDGVARGELTPEKAQDLRKQL